MEYISFALLKNVPYKKIMLFGSGELGELPFGYAVLAKQYQEFQDQSLTDCIVTRRLTDFPYTKLRK